MLGYFSVIPKSRRALDVVTFHGSVMGVDRQKGTEVLLWCATPECPCWQTRRWRDWFRLNLDVVLGSSVPSVQDEVNRAQSIIV
jgi:hypothetical protein